MKKAAIGVLSLLLLTGCWDQMPLRDLHLTDIVGLDLDGTNGDVVLDFVVTTLKTAGQGGGETTSEMTELKGPSLVEAAGQIDYRDKGPFVAINTRLYLMSESFASHAPIHELAFLLHAPYTAVNTPVVIYEGSVSKMLKNKTRGKNEFAKKLSDFISSLETNKIIPSMTMIHYILSREDPFGDLALPVIKQTESDAEFVGALLFRQGISTKTKLDKEQVRMLMLLLGFGKAKQKITGTLSESGLGQQRFVGHLDGLEYGFSIKKDRSKITVRPQSGGLPKVRIGVRLQINAYELGNEVQPLKSDYVNRIEKELSKHLEERALATIKTLQKANCDVLGIGQQLKAYYPNIWKPLDWRKDYPQLSIEPNFHVQILNTAVK